LRFPSLRADNESTSFKELKFLFQLFHPSKTALTGYPTRTEPQIAKKESSSIAFEMNWEPISTDCTLAKP
jgi:hypothetical protein